jgi:uncharacterized membrane protein HdeD (DUF308 family)
MKHWFLLLLAGLVAILGGIFALFNPIEATFAATSRPLAILVLARASGRRFWARWPS